MGLVINQEKTVHMYSGKDTTLHQDLAIGNYIFKRVDNFKYLGTIINKMNNRSVEVDARLTMANRAYYGLQNHMKSRIISRRVLFSEPGGKRPRGRPRLRWEDGVEEDVVRLGCRNWKVVALNREGWRKLLKEAEAHPGL